MMRPDNPLLPNYKYVPDRLPRPRVVARRRAARPCGGPWGQTKPDGADAPSFGPSRRLDYELEVGVFIGPGNALGEPDPDRRDRRPPLRPVPRERLVRARHPGVGVPAARPVPRQELRHDDLAVGRDAGRARAVPGAAGRAAGGRSGAAAVSRRATRTAGAARSTSRSRCSSSSARMRDGGLPPHRLSTQQSPGPVLDARPDGHASRQQRLQPAAGRPARRAAPCPGRRRTRAAACSS